MAAKDAGWTDMPPPAPRWRRLYPRSRLGKLILLLILLLVGVLIWIGMKPKETTSSKVAEVPPAATKASEPVKVASAILPPPPAPSTQAKGTEPVFPPGTKLPPNVSAPKQASEAKAAASVASQPKASSSKPVTAKKEEKKETKQVAVTTPVVKAPRIDATPAPAATPPQGKPFMWTKVGADPCNPKVGCTLAWALEQSKWPAGVQSALMDKVRGESPQAYTMRSGWQGWMTWGKYERKFRANTLAAWPSGQAEASDLWSVAYGGVSYNLVRVQKCKNWGGFATPTTALTQPRPQPSPSDRPLGVIPVVACPEEDE